MNESAVDYINREVESSSNSILLDFKVPGPNNTLIPVHMTLSPEFTFFALRNCPKNASKAIKKQWANILPKDRLQYHLNNLVRDRGGLHFNYELI